MNSAATVLAVLSLAIWLYLLWGRGSFWRADQLLPESPLPAPHRWPSVVALVPGRDEAVVIAAALHSLLAQDYPGPFTILLVDDHSNDATASIAEGLAAQSSGRLAVLRASPLPAGWAGKLWALSEGYRAVESSASPPDYLWLADADIEHRPENLRCLIAKAEADDRDLVSVMAILTCERPWERLLVPPFIFFFQKLYPFAWVNQRQKKIAAAAGGCMVLRRQSFAASGGFAAMRGALIDDCSLARQMQDWRRQQGGDRGGLWLGLSRTARSLRPYAGLGAIWQMVARSAYTQLRHSPLLLLGTLIAMGLTYLLPTVTALTFPWHGNGAAALIGLVAWALMAFAYWPTLKFYRQPAALAPLLPVAAFFYCAMTIDSAVQHWRGRGGAWKGRLQAGMGPAGG